MNGECAESSFINSSFIIHRFLMKIFNPHIKPLEQALAARFGWQTGAAWRDALVAAIDKKAGKLGLDKLAYCRMAIKSAAELESLAELIANSETRFFREPDQFEALRQAVIPQIVQHRAKDKKLNLWSAACSTGEEAYSVAMLVKEALPENEKWKIQLLATDLRGSAIVSATQARYPLSALRSIDPHIRNACFQKAEMNGRERLYSVLPEVRSLVSFRRANLYDASFWKNLSRPFDLILCNNLLMHFHALAAKQTVERLADAMKRDSLLMVMKNEISYVDHPKLVIERSLPPGFFRKV
jgi:chemotaxis protein methyltransferase CheR